MASNFKDVHDFHRKFGLPHPTKPEQLTQDLFDFRVKFMQEELNEFNDAFFAGNMPLMFDALIDLTYVAMGTAVLMGLPWQEGWNEVQRANMAKVRAKRASDSLRGSTYDVVKPAGWERPNIERVVQFALFAEPAHTDPVSL